MSGISSLKKALSSTQGKLDEKLISGFIREQSKKVDSPEMICKICFLFCYVQDLFDRSNQHQENTIWNNRTEMSHRVGVGKSVFGTVEISSDSNMICKWTLIIKYTGFGLAIGVSSNACLPTQQFYDKFDSISYCCFTGDAGYRNDIKSGGSYNCGVPLSARFDSGDTVTMTLDLKNKTISYKVNDEDFGIAFEKIAVSNEIKYRLAIFIDQCLVELKSFTETS